MWPTTNHINKLEKEVVTVDFSIVFVEFSFIHAVHDTDLTLWFLLHFLKSILLTHNSKEHII